MQPMVVAEGLDPCQGADVFGDSVKGAGSCVGADDHGVRDDLAAGVADHDNGGAEL